MSVTQDYKNVRVLADDWSAILMCVSMRIAACVENASLAHGSPSVARYWEQEAEEARALRARVEVL